MRDKDFNGDTEKDIKPWWEDYDGDIEEERREINKRLKALKYDEYFEANPHFKSEESLNRLRRSHLDNFKGLFVDSFIGHILRCTRMKHTSCPYKQNILIVNDNNKFTFLNTSKLDIRNKLDWEEILEKGKTKLRREYVENGWKEGDEWKEGDDDDETRFRVVCVKLLTDEEYKKEQERENELRMLFYKLQTEFI